MTSPAASSATAPGVPGPLPRGSLGTSAPLPVDARPNRRRLYRATDGRALSGVARGLAEHLGVDVLVVRLAFILLTIANGIGVVLYGALWVFVPQDRSAGAAVRPTSRRGTDRGQLVGLALIAVGALVALPSVGGIGNLNIGLLIPLLLAGVGVVLVWRQADTAQRQRWRAGKWPLPFVARGLLGVALVVAGGVAFLAGRGDLQQVGEVWLATLIVVAGLALISGPWWLRMARELSTERRERIRSQERAEIAAHVHDSVLHTLTLIQRNVDDPRVVQRLARAQERELRAWLYRPAPEDEEASFSAAVERVAAEVEDAHGVHVEVVVVGDCPLDERLAATLHAVREALVNAAKYAGDSAISVYAEVEPEQVTVFVRDRGPGFDLDTVPEDRMGVRGSIIGRMERNGGRAVVRSAAGDGTEIRLEMGRMG